MEHGNSSLGSNMGRVRVHVAESSCLQLRIRTGRSQDAVEDKNLVRSVEGAPKSVKTLKYTLPYYSLSLINTHTFYLILK